MQISIEDKLIGQRLQFRRNELGISQIRLGSYENITFQQIQKYERGKNRIFSARLYKFSQILHVPITYFFEELKYACGNNHKNLEENNKIIDVSKLSKIVFKISNKISRQTLINMAKNLLRDEKQKKKLIKNINNNKK